jgi:hypothetical protein
LSKGAITPEQYQSKMIIYTDLIAASKKSLADLEVKQNKAQFMHNLALYRSLT